MKVKFYLDSKKTQRPEKAIWCYIREYNETLAINTGEIVTPEHWDKQSQRANLRKTRDQIKKGSLKNLNQYLNAFENKIFDITRTVRSKDFSAGFSLVADEIKKQFNKKETGFWSIFDEFKKSKKLHVSKQSLQKYSRLEGLLQEFENYSRNKIRFELINPKFFEDFYSFLIDRKSYLNNTANKTIQFFKTFLIWANTNGFTDNSNHKAFKGKFEQNEVVFLSEEELMKLYNLEIGNERLSRVRDIFVFQCFTGVRYSDILNISREDLRNATWYLRTQKTKDILQIPLNSFSLSILAKYQDHPTPLPVISNQKMNKYLKELCELAEINEVVKTVQYKGNERIEKTNKKFEVIGTHTARRTFISLSLQKGMKPDVIMAITGHTTYKMMQKYLKIADHHKRDEMDKVWGIPLRQIK
ncbi:MAG: tyrosine-type recombinase/integrase [Melioribacteraceae bacterium]|nr:tyrosine-type recombinase/integrase [Melioribacteraceae bacterium]